jgi:DnaJ-related protein SCJ1
MEFKYISHKRFLPILFIFLLNLLVVSAGDDFYKILEIPREADNKQIKKSFRTLSLKYHPDKNPGDKYAHEMFLKINKAYETLSDPEKRKIYDIYGEEGLSQNNLMNENKQRGPNAKFDIHLDLEDLYNGATKEIQLQKNIICPKCHGTGGKLGKTKQCHQCQGRGVVMQEINTGMGFTFRTQAQCPHCKGKGIVFSETCDHCRGRRVIKEDKTLRVDIEKGMRDGQTIVFERESEQHPDTIPGDLIIHLRQHAHRFFHTRVADDLHANVPLNLKEALLGFNKKFTHLDKREVIISSEKPTQPFHIKKIAEEGMPQHKFPSHKGDLYIKYIVRLPEKLNEAEKELVRQLL